MNQQHSSSINQKQSYSDRHGEHMIVLLRKINNAVKYIVCFIVFIICVTRTRPGDLGVLPAYYLIASLFLAAIVKILKKVLKQPRPEAEQCMYHHPEKYKPNHLKNQGPTSIVSGEDVGEEENEQGNEQDKDKDDDYNNYFSSSSSNNDDDHGMPSSHSALLGFFSWIAVFGLFSHDAFGLFSRALSGLVGIFLPIMQMIFDGSAVLGLLSAKQQSTFDRMADGHSKGSESLTFLLIVVMTALTILSLGLFGSFLRVINGDHTPAQAFVGYLLGFVWSCASVVAENQVFKVNEQSVGVQQMWMGVAIVLGLIGGYLILIVKKKKRSQLQKKM